MIRVIKKGDPKHEGEAVIFIGRPSALGNPFILNREEDRNDVIAKYETYARNRLGEEYELGAAIMMIAKRLRDGEKIALQCYCAPKACHGDVLVKLIWERLQDES